eukprot:10088364-Alexandrium_andersonii.AAC.1
MRELQGRLVKTRTGRKTRKLEAFQNEAHCDIAGIAIAAGEERMMRAKEGTHIRLSAPAGNTAGKRGAEAFGNAERRA